MLFLLIVKFLTSNLDNFTKFWFNIHRKITLMLMLLTLQLRHFTWLSGIGIVVALILMVLCAGGQVYSRKRYRRCKKAMAIKYQSVPSLIKIE
uniref:Magnetosome protein Mad2 n=1 Tax=Strongyloides stercoralis TaxID=6248 RepID=A0A0K0DTV3_STRER